MNYEKMNGQHKGRQMNKQSKQDKSEPSYSIIDIPCTKNRTRLEIDYLFAGPGTEADRVESVETKLKMHDKFSDVFARNTCVMGTFCLQVKDDVKPHQALLMCIVYIF